MKCYLLHEPTAIEKKLRKLISGSAKSNEEWGTYPAGQVRVLVEKPGRKACVIGRDHQKEGGFFRTLLLIDALRRSGAKEVTLILPYFAYGRADRVTHDSSAVAADMIMEQFEAAGVTYVITGDLHSLLTKEHSIAPLDNVAILPLLASKIPKSLLKNGITIVSPDGGGRRRAAEVAVAMGDDEIAWVEKKRLGPGKVKTYGFKGKLRGELVIIVDDLVDTGNTLVQAVRVLKEAGAKRFCLCVTHPAFSGDAARRIARLGFESILVSDTVPLSASAKKLKNLKVISAAELLAESIR